MAGTPVTVRFRAAYADTNEHLIGEIIAPTNQCLIVRRIEYTEGGTSGTAARTRLRSTVGGTDSGGTPEAGTNYVIAKQDTDQGLTLQTTARAKFISTNVPATTGEAVGPYGGEADPQRGLATWNGYLRIQQGTRFRIYGTPPATNNYTLTVYLEE